MTITITDAEGSIEEIKAAVVKEIITDMGGSLRLVSAQQGCGLLDLTMNAFNSLQLPKVDLLGNGRAIRYRLSDIEALVAERTIKAKRRK